MAARKGTARLWGGGFIAPCRPAAQRGLWALMLRWHQRAAERYRLRDLSDHELKDIGLSRREIETESGKPFWKE